MSYVIAAPEGMLATAADLASIGSNLNAAHVVAAVPTAALVPAAADEVSAGVAHLFCRYAEGFHGLAGTASAFHEQFVGHLKASAGAYSSMEDANATLLQRMIYHLQLLHLAGHEIVDGEALQSTKRHLRSDFGPLAQDIAAVAFAVLVVGFFVVAVPLVVVLQMIESFVQRLGSLLP
jgi:hypothetical protein